MTYRRLVTRTYLDWLSNSAGHSEAFICVMFVSFEGGSHVSTHSMAVRDNAKTERTKRTTIVHFPLFERIMSLNPGFSGEVVPVWMNVRDW